MPINEVCTVVKKSGENATRVLLKKTPKCEGCKACGFGRKTEIVLDVVDFLGCENGERVLIEMPEKSVLAAPIFMYLMPLVAFAIGLFAALPLGEGWMILCAFAAAIVTLPVLYVIDRTYKKNTKYMPKIIKKIEQEEEKGDLS